MLKDELKNFLSGTGKTKHENLIHAISGYLTASEKTSEKIKNTRRSKQEEARFITEYLNLHKQPDIKINESRFIAEGAEQRIYLGDNGIDVIKLNSGIFYYNWSDYFRSLMVHNFFFPATAYVLLGFSKKENDLYAAVKQPYVVANEITNIESVKTIMNANGFILKKNNDYYNDLAGIIAEDLHEENVLTRDGVLFFIDTVFYLTSDFYN